MTLLPSAEWSFRPSQMKEEAFIKTFTNREGEIHDIFSHIDMNLIPPKPGTNSSNKKNLFILGPRGIGKTAILHYINIRLHNEESYRLEKIIPIFFNEKENFNTAAHLIRRIYEIIIDDPVFFNRLSHCQEWKTAYSDIKEKKSHAFSTLQNTLSSEKKKLVLFIENYDTLIYQVLRLKGEKKESDSGSQEIFRKIVMDPDILLICTGLVKKPLTKYDYGKKTFKVIELQPLENLAELLHKRMRFDNNISLLSQQEKLKSKIDTFKYLTSGGNTRIMVLLYEQYSLKGFYKLEFLLDDMLNKSTPLFEWMLEKFIDFKSQEMLSSIVQRDGNATIKEIASDLDSTESTVRTLISRLREKNIVEKVYEKRNQSDIYIIKPLMFFLWHQKCVLQKKDPLTVFFIHFIDFFFDPAELTNREEVEVVYRPQGDFDNNFVTDFNNTSRYMEAGRFPLKGSDDKKETETPDSEIEKLLYEVVRAKKDDSILKEKIIDANSLKAENNLEKAADLFRIISRGYLILAETSQESYSHYKKAEENIRRAIEIYKTLKLKPMEHVRCLMILVEILSEYAREPVQDIATFTGEIIKIGKNVQSDDFIPHIGYAYKYLGFSLKDPKEKLGTFQTAMEYFKKSKNEKIQIIIVLVNMGLVHKKIRKYKTALDYFEEALELSQQAQIWEYLNSIILLLFEVYRISQRFQEGLKRIDQILAWLEAEGKDIKGIDYKKLSNFKAFFLDRNDKIIETKEYLLKNYETGKKEEDPHTVVVSLLNLVNLNQRLGNKEEVEKGIRKISAIISEATDFTENILHKIAHLFHTIGDCKNEKLINKKLLENYLGDKKVKEQAGIHINMGLCCQKENKFEEAERNYRQAIAVCEENQLTEILHIAQFNLAVLSEKKGNIDEALRILGNLGEELNPSSDTDTRMIYEVKNKLFFLHLLNSKHLLKEKDSDAAAISVTESIKYTDDLSMEDFVRGFCFSFILSLIEIQGTALLPFFNKLDYFLSESYRYRRKGRYIKIISYVKEILKGEDINRLTKGLPLLKREVLRLIKERLETSDEHSRRSSPQSGNHDDGEKKKLEQVRSLLKTRRSEYIDSAEQLLKTVKVEPLTLNSKFDFYFLEMSILLLTQRKEKIKDSLADLLELVSGAPAVLAMETHYSDLKNMLDEALNPVDFDYLNRIESMIQNKTPLSRFTDKFSNHIDPRFYNEFKNRLKVSGKKIFNRVAGEGIAAIDDIVTLSGSRIHMESLLYNINLQYPELPGEIQTKVISILTGTLRELPESYKWLVLDFFSGQIVNLKPQHQAELVRGIVKLVEKKRGTDYFIKETTAFLQTAKHILAEDLREQIEKALIKI